MTGESLMNNSFDIMGKQVAQGSVMGLDSLFKPGIAEILAVILGLGIVYVVYKGLRKTRI